MLQRLHELKLEPELYDVMAAGDKRFEIRKDDRHFQREDLIKLSVYDGRLPVNRQPIAEPLFFKITFVLRGGQYGLEPGYVALGLREFDHARDPSPRKPEGGGQARRLLSGEPRGPDEGGGRED